jgi:type II secretory pathway component GspD/PulD (secretin)
MKAQLKLFSLVGLMAGSLACLGQENTAATPAAAPATAADAAASTAQAEANPNEVIPLIVMDDVGLIDAIKNLARQARLNFVMDPKVPYGGIGPNNVPIPEPKISIRWEKLTAQQALTALLNNYNLVIVDDPKTSIARVTVKDPAAPDPLLIHNIQLKFANPTNLALIVQASFTDPLKRSKVLADVRSSTLVVVATEKELHDVETLIEQLDQPPKQVLIETKILETTMDPKTAKGIDWSGTFEAQKMTFGNGFASGVFNRTTSGGSTSVTLPGGRTITSSSGGSQSGTITTDVGNGGLSLNTLSGFTPGIGFLNADGVSAVLSFINQNSDARVLSEPRAVTLDNETAQLSVTRANPIFKNTAGTQGSPGGSEVTYTNLGTILNVTPRISANDFIQLHVVPEVSSVAFTVRKTVASTVNEADVYDMRKIETRVLIPSGNTLVLGGLMAENNSTTSSKVPLAGDIPGIGNLFKKKARVQHKSNLLIFITPTIVKDSDFRPSESQFMGRAYLDGVPVPQKEWSAWDSTEPYDWSKRENKGTTGNR